MPKFLITIFILMFIGCSDHKKNKSAESPSPPTHSFPIYKKSEILLAIKYNLPESAIKEISRITKGKDVIHFEDNTARRYTWSGDSDYVAQIRKLVNDFSTKYKMPPATVANILIDRQILEVRETLPDDVAEKVIDRMTPEPNNDE